MKSAAFLLLALVAPVAADVRFTALAWDDSVLSHQFHYANGNDLVEVQDLHPLKRSPVHTWKGDGTCLFSLNGRNPGTADEPALPPTDYIKVPFPPGGTDFLVLISPDPGSPAGLRALVYEDSASRFPWGSYRVLNGTGSPLLMKVGPDGPRFLLSKAEIFQPGGEKRNLPVGIVAKADPNKLLYSSVWQHRPDQRRLVFVAISDNARRGVLELKVVPERRSEYDRQRGNDD